MGNSLYKYYENVINDKYIDYDGNEMSLNNSSKTQFLKLVNSIKSLLNYSGDIVNGDLDILETDSNKATNGVYIKNDFNEYLIIIDNTVIDKCISFKLEYFLINTICHEIAHHTYFNHSKKHTQLTEDYINIVNSQIKF